MIVVFLFQDDDFIVRDEEVEQELIQGKEAEQMQKRRKKKRMPREYRSENEDYELIKENTGIEIKKRGRLKKNADNDGGDMQVKREIEVPVESVRQAKQSDIKPIDTTSGGQRGGRDHYKSEYAREKLEYSTRDVDQRVKKSRVYADDADFQANRDN